MIKVIQWVLKAGTAGVISLIILSVVTIFYSHSGVHITNKTGATDYKWESGQFRSNMTEGFSWLRLNGDGFNNSFDLAETKDVDVLLMGSSHMEAVNVNKQRNVGYLLNEKMPELTTYNIGISGHTIYQCVNNLEDAVSYYKPRKYIIIETDRIDLDEKQMNQVINNTLTHITSHDSGIMYRIQKYVPCLLPLYREFKNWRNSSVRIDETEKVSELQYDDMYDFTLNSFVKKISDDAKGRNIIIIYHPNTAIDENGKLLKDDEQAVEKFEEVCKMNEISFINMYNDFEAQYETKHKLAHGFINTAVGYGHLNEDGHRLISNKLVERIRAYQNGDE